MKRDDSVYLRHILDAIAKAEDYLQDVDEDAFGQTTLIQDGVIRQLEIIGEATKHLSDELRQKYAHVPLFRRLDCLRRIERAVRPFDGALAVR